MNNPLDFIYVNLTESVTKNKIKLQASIIGAIIENSKGGADVWTKLSQNGDSKVFVVLESPDELIESMREAYLMTQNKNKGKK